MEAAQPVPGKLFPDMPESRRSDRIKMKESVGFDEKIMVSQIPLFVRLDRYPSCSTIRWKPSCCDCNRGGLHLAGTFSQVHLSRAFTILSSPNGQSPRSEASYP
ncbi:hypothetical protein Ac2012v2_004570 [Leucoagaricus gongylophorus]